MLFFLRRFAFSLTIRYSRLFSFPVERQNEKMQGGDSFLVRFSPCFNATRQLREHENIAKKRNRYTKKRF